MIRRLVRRSARYAILASPLADLHRHRSLLGYRYRVFVGLGVAGFLAGIGQAAVLLILVRSGAALTAGTESFEAQVGPLSLSELSTRTILILGFVIVTALMLIDVAVAHVMARLRASVLTRLRRRVFDGFTAASWSRQQMEQPGEMLQVLQANTGKATSAVMAAAGSTAALASFLSLFLGAIVIQPIPAILAVVAIIALVAAARPLRIAARRIAREQSLMNKSIAGSISERVTVAQEIQAFGVAGPSAKPVHESLQHLRGLIYRSSFLAQLSSSLFKNIALALILSTLAVIQLSGATNLAALSAVILILLRSMNYGQRIQSLYHSLQESAPWIEHLDEQLTSYETTGLDEVARAPASRVAIDNVQTLEMRDVSFSYIDGIDVLSGVDLLITKGEAVGIIGPSGAGKSTLMQLILRLRVPTAGHMLVNGEEAKSITPQDWLRHIAFVPQESLLLSLTVRENIRFFRDWIDDHAVERAAKLAGIHDQILSWPDGYDTDPGSRGSSLSGGQRQRIAIARALADDPDIVVLDEPTSSLDAQSEQLVQESLASLKRTTTLIVVAHREATLQICDRILEVASGLVTELSQQNHGS